MQGFFDYFLRNLEKMLPLPVGSTAGAVGEGPGALPRAGKGREDFWALAGTARGASGLLTPGRGTDPAGGTGLRAAIPGFGVGLRLIFSACRAAVAGAITGTVAAERVFSRAVASLSMAAVRRSIFWESWDAQAGSGVEDKEAGEEACPAPGEEAGAAAGVEAGFKFEKAIHSVPPSMTTKVVSVTVPAAFRARRPEMGTGPAAWFWGST